jgi:hypothetical protein
VKSLGVLVTFSLLEAAASCPLPIANNPDDFPPDVVLIRDITAAAAFSRTLGCCAPSLAPLLDKEGKKVDLDCLTFGADGALACFDAKLVDAGCRVAVLGLLLSIDAVARWVNVGLSVGGLSSDRRPAYGSCG